MKKLFLLALFGLGACYLPPETEPRQSVRVIYVYVPSFYDYRYDDFRYQNCWSMDCRNYPLFTNRPRTGINTPFGIVPPNRVPQQPLRTAPRIARPRPPELPHRMIPRPPEAPSRSEPLRTEPRTAHPRPQEIPKPQ